MEMQGFLGGIDMDLKSALGGILLFLGLTNVLGTFGISIPVQISLGFYVAGYELGSLILGLVFLFLAYQMLFKSDKK